MGLVYVGLSVAGGQRDWARRGHSRYVKYGRGTSGALCSDGFDWGRRDGVGAPEPGCARLEEGTKGVAGADGGLGEAACPDAADWRGTGGGRGDVGFVAGGGRLALCGVTSDWWVSRYGGLSLFEVGSRMTDRVSSVARFSGSTFGRSVEGAARAGSGVAEAGGEVSLEP